MTKSAYVWQRNDAAEQWDLIYDPTGHKVSYVTFRFLSDAMMSRADLELWIDRVHGVPLPEEAYQ